MPARLFEPDEHPMKACSSVNGLFYCRRHQPSEGRQSSGVLFRLETPEPVWGRFLKLGIVEGVERPAICAILDITETTPVVLVDAGANADCKPHYLLQFA